MKHAINNQNINKEYLIETFNILCYMGNKIAEVDKDNIVLKGGTALLDRVIDLKLPTMRITHDLDINISNENTYNLVFSNILRLLNDNNLGLDFSLKRHRGRKGTGEGFEFNVTCTDGRVLNFGIDMQIAQRGIIGTIPGVHINLREYDNYTMLVDKVSAASSTRIFRRIRDLYDIYILSKLQSYDMEILIQCIKAKRPELFMSKVNMFNSDTVKDLEHAYDMYEGIINKPEFAVIYEASSSFVLPIHEVMDSTGRYTHWNRLKASWM